MLLNIFSECAFRNNSFPNFVFDDNTGNCVFLKTCLRVSSGNLIFVQRIPFSLNITSCLVLSSSTGFSCWAFITKKWKAIFKSWTEGDFLWNLFFAIMLCTMHHTLKTLLRFWILRRFDQMSFSSGSGSMPTAHAIARFSSPSTLKECLSWAGELATSFIQEGPFCHSSEDRYWNLQSDLVPLSAKFHFEGIQKKCVGILNKRTDLWISKTRLTT